MCGDGHENPSLGEEEDPTPPKQPRTHDASPFPWHLPVCDAHCHPIENMTTAKAISGMRARILTVMGTRSQDQHLVTKLTEKHKFPSSREAAFGESARENGQFDETSVVPAFGWHPWFSFELFDDIGVEEQDWTYKAGKTEQEDQEARKKHYQAVLQPDPGNDAAFLASLPAPTALSEFISATRTRLEAHPFALVGEIGLDKAFRLPGAWLPEAHAGRDPTRTPGGRERRRLSPFHVRMPHQQAVVKAQLQLAGEMGRPVSVHGVQAHGVLFETLASTWKGHEKESRSSMKKRRAAPNAEDDSDDQVVNDNPSDTTTRKRVPSSTSKVKSPYYPPRICLHSYSGKVDVARQYLNRSVPASIFFSFSVVVNMSTQSSISKMTEVVKGIPDDRILVESDLHAAGERMDGLLEDMYRQICEIKGWELEHGVKRIAKNYEEFIWGVKVTN